MKISIIIPVYNAEKFLKKSLGSLAMQNCHDFEVVFVDDCSTDGSLAILEEFSRTSGLECKIIRQSKNGGVAAARNRALDAAEGEYLMWLDADDTLAPEAVSKAVVTAMETGADIIGWDWTLGFDHNGRYMRQADYDKPVQALKNMMGGIMRWNLWLFMIRRSIVEKNGIRFIPGANMGEDMMFVMKAFLCSSSSVQIHKSLYCYNAVSAGSISRQFSKERRQEVSCNLEDVQQALGNSEYAGELFPYLDYLKLFIKLPLLMSSDRADYRIWYNWMPESNKAAMSNRMVPMRTRLVQWMASHRLWIGVWAYYIFVYKFVYGLIYR